MLANKDFTCFDQLATKALHTQTLGIRIADHCGNFRHLSYVPSCVLLMQ
jgi:hypothetical protein